MQGACIAASGGILSMVVAFAMSIWRAREARTAATYGSARWATASEVQTAKLMGPDGVVLGRFGRQYLRHNGPEHVLCFAPTRSGKGVGLVVPTLLTWPGSCIVHDIKGENWNLTSGFRVHGAIDKLLAARRQSGAGEFRRILLETSGLAMPGPILRSLMRYDRAEYRLRIVSTLDAVNSEMDDVTFAIRSAQLIAARSIVVTKLDRVSASGIAAAERVARRFNPAAGLIVTPDRQARAQAAFAPSELEARTAPSQFQAIAATDHSRLGVFLAEWPAAVPWTDLGDWIEDLAGLCGDRLLRVKGLVSVNGVARPILIDGVGTTFAEPRWIEAVASTGRGIVIIARDIELGELTSMSAAYSADVRPAVKLTSRRAA
jgi:G3E family GTPase